MLELRIKIYRYENIGVQGLSNINFIIKMSQSFDGIKSIFKDFQFKAVNLFTMDSIFYPSHSILWNVTKMKGSKKDFFLGAI